MAYEHDWMQEPIPELTPTYGDVAREYIEREERIPDPTSLVLVDEADRLRMAASNRFVRFSIKGRSG